VDVPAPAISARGGPEHEPPREDASRQSAPACREGRRRFELIEGLRAVAVLSVLAGHAAHAWFPPGEESLRIHVVDRLLPFGVALFFCISGFVLYRPFIVRRGPAGTRVGLSSYALRRLVRIVPPYWVALTALAVFPGLTGVFSDQWLAYYGFAQIYSSDWAAGGLGTAWTLDVEILFYAALPLYAWAMSARGVRAGNPGGRKRELMTLTALAGLSLALRGLDFAYLGGDLHWLGTSLLGTFSWFALGMAVAVFSCTAAHEPLGAPARTLGSRPLVSGACAAAIFAVLVAVPGYEPGYFGPIWQVMLEFLAVGAMATLLLLIGVFGERARLARTVLGNRVSVWLGLVSYGIYLWHAPVLTYLSKTDLVASFPVPVVAFTVSSLAVVLSLAAASFYLLERPLLRWAGSGASRDGRLFVRRRSSRAALRRPRDRQCLRPVLPGGVTPEGGTCAPDRLQIERRSTGVQGPVSPPFAQAPEPTVQWSRRPIRYQRVAHVAQVVQDHERRVAE